MRLEALKNKKILILGFGREGRDTFLALRKKFPKQVFGIADQNKIEPPDKKTIVFYGKNYLKNLKNFDVIIRTPGIPFATLKPLAKKGTKITSQIGLFLDNFPGLVIGITGTKGKGTTSSLLYSMLKKARLPVFLGGNIGQPVLQCMLKSKPEHIFVYEMSDHQLQGLKKSPQIAVFLNFFPDHLDYYKNLAEYKKAKENIALYQTKDDFFIYNSKDKTAANLAKKTKAQKIAFDRTKLKVKTRLIGEFNLLNVKAAFCVGKLLGIAEKSLISTIGGFNGLEHRLEYVGKFRGVEFYDDSMSTLPQAAICALKALPKTTTMLVGGSDKGADYKKMGQAILKSKVRNLVVLGKGTGQKIVKIIQAQSKPSNIPQVFVVNGKNAMEGAVKIAYLKTKRGEVCLLSPGSASFNLFSDFRHRGELFQKYIKKYGSRVIEGSDPSKKICSKNLK